jgi:DNA ligase-associated metallophosphoesterase
MSLDYTTSSWSIHEEEFILHPLRFLYWEKEKMILVSDIHSGKSTELLHYGIYLPLDQINSLYHRLETIAKLYPNSHLVIVGDMVHGKENVEWNQFLSIFRYFSKVTLVKGNHDQYMDAWCKKVGLEVKDMIQIRDIIISHEPIENVGNNTILNIHGHIHPWVKLKGKGKQSLKFPCFYKKGKQLCLPAFTKLTGKFTVELKKGDIAWAITESSCITYEY